MVEMAVVQDVAIVILLAGGLVGIQIVRAILKPVTGGGHVLKHGSIVAGEFAIPYLPLASSRSGKENTMTTPNIYQLHGHNLGVGGSKSEPRVLAALI